MEREVLLTGIGGQGVQLAAKVLALAATAEGREVMWLGTYGGTMRGGNTDATIVLADEPIVSPPMVCRAWSAIICHPRFFEPFRDKMQPDGFVVVDEDLLEGDLGLVGTKILPVPATTIARENDVPKGTSLVLLGAYAALTGVVSPDALAAALDEALPSYRKETLESNLRALAAGRDALPALGVPAWTSEAA